MIIKGIKRIRKKSIGSLILLLFILSFAISPALLFGNFSGIRKVNANPKTSTNYLYKDKTYIFNLDDFYDDANLYKTYTGTKFQTEAFDGEALEWSGTISNDTVTPVNNTETHYASPSGHYEATYSFEGDEGVPDGWIVGGGATVSTISDFQEHNKVMTILGDGGAGWDYVYNSFDNQLFGVIELWYATSDVITQSRIQIQDGGIASICIRAASGGTLQYLDGTPTWHVVGAMSTDTWYHFKIQWYVDNTYDLYIDRVLIDSGITFYSNMSTGLDRILIQQYIASHIQYVDAVGIKIGHYEATYSFEDDAVGSMPTGWSKSVQVSAEIIAEYQGHSKVLYSNGTTQSWTSISHDLSQPDDFTIEFWCALGQTNSRVDFYMVSAAVGILFHSDGNLRTSKGTVLQSYNPFQWYHIRIDVRSATYKYDVYIDEILKKENEDWYYTEPPNNYINRFRIEFRTLDPRELWFDAFGEDWDSGYNIGDNLKPYDPDYEIGMNLYSYNINMTKGSYDYTDNMRANDDAYTDFTSTHTTGNPREIPSQWDNFTFTNGTGDTIGELETIDADYSIIDSTIGVFIPDEFINSISYTWATAGTGLLSYTYIDNSQYKQVNAKHVYEGYYSLDITLNFIPALAGRDFYISAHITTSAGVTGHLKINEAIWKSGTNIDFDDEFHAGVTSIIFEPDGYMGTYYSRIYYFKIVEVGEEAPAELDVQVDMQVDNPDCSSVGFLKYSHKTNVSQIMNFSIWNWVGSTWYEIESVDNSVSFDDDSFTLGITSVYVNSSFGVRIRFQGLNTTNDFELQVDRLRLDYITPPAELEFTITFSFTNYDEDLLAMTIQSWQKTNKSQTIVFSIWNYNTETYTQISSSSDTTEALKEYNSTSPSNFLSSTGITKLHWNGTDTLNDFELHIDYLFIQIFYKLDLVHSKSFDTLGIYRYRWAVIGSIHYTSWVTFEVIDPVPNFHAISESDYTTRWELIGATIPPFENFTDDIDPSSAWDLDGVSPTDFNVYIPELEDYLTDDMTFYGSSYESPAQWGDFAFTKGAGNTIGELETNDADYAIVDASFSSGADETELGYIDPYDDDIYTNWNEGDVAPHWNKLDEGGDAPDGGNIRESSEDVHDRWIFESLDIPAGRYVSKLRFYGYCKCEPGTNSDIEITTSVGATSYWGAFGDTYGWQSSEATGLNFGQAELDAFWMNVEVDHFTHPGWVDIECVYVKVYTSLKHYSVNYVMTWDVDDPESIENFSYDYRTTLAVDCDLDIYNWDDENWNTELESNTGTGWYTNNYTLTDPYISVTDQISVRFQSAPATTDFDMELDQIVLVYNSMYTISKKHNNSIAGYAYMQTNETESIALQSTNYGSHYTLNSSDYFEVDFQTSSDSLINLILLKDGAVNKTLTLSQSGNTNFNRHTVQITTDETVEFDQLKINSTFEDTDYVRVYDIKTYKYALTGDTADFRVCSHQDYFIYLTPDLYNLKIHDPHDGDVKININITISSGYNFYIYEPTALKQCRITFFNPDDIPLTFTDYHVYINRSLGGSYSLFTLLENIFSVDVDTIVYINISDRVGTLLKEYEKEITPTTDYLDIKLDVYRLQIKNLMLQKTIVDINNKSHEYPLLSGDSLYFWLSVDYYWIGYYNPNNIYTQFYIHLTSNQAYELNMSRICNIYYTNQRMEPLNFYQFKTYINGTRIINNMFYATDGEHKGIEVKDLSDISVLNYTYVEGTQEYNQVSLILTQYSLKVMNLQLCFNHINITRDPDYYSSSYYWSEWIAPGQVTEYFLFAGYYKMNISSKENETYSYYDFTLAGDDCILITSNNTIYNVIYNLANVNATIGNQITNIFIDLTNQNSNINNTIINIEINLGNINSTLGSILLDIDVAISNINSSIISEIVSLGTEINNINTSITNEILNIGVDITNINSSIISQILTLGVDISNINGSIINQIIDLGVDVSNINTSLSEQILTIGVDISNVNTSITNQILLMIADISNVNASIINQTLVMLSDISNVNSTLLNQMAVLGMDITNINASITNQILDLSVDLTNINSSITDMLTNINISISNLENDIGTFYAFTNTSFINLNNVMNTSFINIENTIISINQTISNLVIGVSNDIYLINGTISSMISQLETNLFLMNVSLNATLFDLDTTLNLIGSNITSNYILLNNSIYLNNLNINDSRIAIINNLMLVNNTISNLISEVYSAVYLINNSIYTAVVDLGTYLSLMNNTIYGNLSIVLEQNEFLTELYRMTMFSDLLNWTDIGLNISLLTSQIDVWTFINNYRNQSVEVHLRYQDLIEKLVISADDLLEQYLPYDGVEYREWSVELQEYIGEWKDLIKKNKTVEFGFFDTEVPEVPLPQFVEGVTQWLIIGVIVLIAIIIVVFVYYKLKIAQWKQERRNRVENPYPLAKTKNPYI